jgi:predicted ester cyclase
MRAAIPDLRSEIKQMIVAGDRVVTHLRLRGHFTEASARPKARLNDQFHRHRQLLCLR